MLPRTACALILGLVLAAHPHTTQQQQRGVEAGEHYTVDYGGEAGKARVALDSRHHVAYITPPAALQPTTFIDFKKGVVVYLVDGECLVEGQRVSQRRYARWVLLHAHTTPPSTPPPTRTLYVAGRIPSTRSKVRAAVGEQLADWCEGRPTWHLTPTRPPPSISAQHLNIAPLTQPTQRRGRIRSKRSSGRRQHNLRSTQDRRLGRGRVRGRSEASHTPRTKSLPRPHILPNGKARPRTKSLAGPHTKVIVRPRTQSVESDKVKTHDPASGAQVPPVVVTQLPPNNSASGEASQTPVILQEEPYLSPSFVRKDEDGQGFRHYRDFYQESGEEVNGEGEAATSDHHHTRPNVRSFAMPETIVKDGQIFYRYDAGVDASGSIKGQSKRSNARDGHPPADDLPLSSEQGSTTVAPQHLEVSRTGHTPMMDGIDFLPGSTQVQTQAQMGGGMHSAVAGAVMGSGPVASQVVGSSGPSGFFSAQAHSTGHPGGMSQTQVMGNMHGVQGLAMTQRNGHQSEAHLQMGAHSSSMAQVSAPDGTPLLVSNVDATQEGGSAGAQAHAPAAANTHAQMDFTPTQEHHDSSGLRGQGLASAVMTSEGGSALASLAGDVSGGSYLGVAQSSSGLHPHLADAQPSPPPHTDQYSPHSQLSANGFSQGRGRVQKEFSHRDFVHPASGPEEFTDDPYVHGDFSPSEVAHEFPSHTGQVEHEELMTTNFNPAGLVQGGGREDVPRVDQPLAPNIPAHSSMTHDMLSNIMETVHQPHMEPEVAAYPSQAVTYPGSDYVIDEGGMTGGAGTPPRKGEVGQAPLHTRPHIEEGIGISAGTAHGGQVGLATYSQGHLGPAPSPGDLLGSSPYYDYNTYDHPNSEYYDTEYNVLTGQQAPYFDLGPEIFRLETLELDYDHLQPSALVTPSTQSPEQHPDEQEGHHPDIVVHQVQTTTPQLPSERPHFTLPQQPHTTTTQLPSERPHFTLPQQPHTTTPQLPREDSLFTLPQQPHTTTPHLPSEDPLFTAPQQPHTSAPQPLPRVETHMPASHGQEAGGSYEGRGSASQPESRPWVAQTDVAEDMDSVPLVPARPGSSVTLPGITGGPVVNVMTMPASHKMMNSSLLAQRPGTPIQPGEKIPGAPGYRVPPGFRGHVILGHKLPIEADSRRVVEGFNTHVRLNPQDQLSSTVYASVGGPQASQYLSDNGTPGIHVTLSGGGGSHSTRETSFTSSRSSGSSTASRQTMPGSQQRPSSQWRTSNTRPSNPVLTHSPMRARPRSESHPTRTPSRTAWNSGRGGSSYDKSWDGGRTPGKSWSQTWRSNNGKSWDRDDQQQPTMCGTFTVTCQVVYSPYQQSEVCRPAYTVHECCC